MACPSSAQSFFIPENEQARPSIRSVTSVIARQVHHSPVIWNNRFTGGRSQRACS